MQISKEQLENDIALGKTAIENIKASLNFNLGALSVLETMLVYVQKEVEYSKSDFISDVNKNIQARDEALAELFQGAQPNLDIDYPEYEEEEQG